ncbi:MerR family transcriptional regulator [Nocardiopsis sp. RSe5-2]|uniref:MerR family transcriptional regulator n=1 Tax=Nocardiopsis endophytica TaxID=3018445 RepID=A0ABT4TYK7_9ACTN|nr:MerR family transcriptional regulator [Nocardiopsis endophytica]MDA2809770.1 MerR family transcriptional regulator [Nocardiopsis endophytica]
MGTQAPEAGLLDIGEVARRTGLAPSALRYYEKEGLIAPAARNGLRRAYDPGVLHRLGVLTCARSAGFTIAEVRAFLSGTPDDAELRGRLAAKAREVDEAIGRLVRLRDSLAHAAGCDHDPLVECPEFKRAVGRVADPDRDACGPGGA